MASFIGTYLRLFIDSKQLSKGWMQISHIQMLKNLVLLNDFNIEAEALETMEVLFLNHFDEGGEILNKAYVDFVNSNAEEILKLLTDMIKEITASDTTDLFALRTCMKLLYQII